MKCLNEFDNKSIIVTGAGGLIGSMLVKGILKYAQDNCSHIKVVAFVHTRNKVDEVFGNYLDNGNLEIIAQDVNDCLIYDGDVDYIVHAASITSSRRFVSNPVETIKTSINGSINVLELAKAKRVKSIIYLSSLEVYGTFDSKGIRHIEEIDYGYIDVLNVRSSYSESKRMAENIFVSYAAEYNIPIKIARLAQTFGAGVDYMDNRVFGEFARCAVEGRNIILHTKGETVRNYCYVTDAVKAILHILLHGENGAAYNVAGDDTTVSIYDMAKLFCKYSKYGIEVEIHDDANALMGYNPVMQISLCNKKIKLLGWYSEYNIDAIIKRFMNYMEKTN
jgi:dTDP-glucose 4,6-dehydratase